ncbi:hypothetical protein AO263_01630 [Pseudomonas sp. NZIPFR-PS5]|nr:hypothetical protein AO263_01630 [Pseudomonas sp. NZIPFR-PS5]
MRVVYEVIMPWAFFLLLMLNGLYFVWQQQDAPLRPKEVEPLLTHRSYGQDIRLLSESGLGRGKERMDAEQEKCLYLGGTAKRAEVTLLEQRLVALDIDTHLGKNALIAELRRDFPMLKNEIMSCEGIATPD